MMSCFVTLPVAERIIALTGSRAKIIHQPLPADDPKQRQPDISLARETLSYQPQVSLKQGLVFTLERDGRLRQK